MTDVVVYGASGFGQQVMFWVEDAIAAGADWNVLGFVDDEAESHGDERTGHRVLGGAEWLQERAGTGGLAAVLGVAVPRVKELIAQRLHDAGVELLTVIHPTVVRSKHAHVGAGSLVGPLNVLSTNVRIGDCVIVNTACTLGHDVTAEDYATLLPGCNISGHVTIGRGATIGTNAAVIQNITVGAGAILGAGATAVTDIAPAVTAVGTPARPV